MPFLKAQSPNRNSGCKKKGLTQIRPGPQFAPANAHSTCDIMLRCAFRGRGLLRAAPGLASELIEPKFKPWRFFVRGVFDLSTGSFAPVNGHR